ncbi:YveK family protein [Paenibacillus sp. PAMC21692]|uniref:YveK family protein n=1 Tax=Paenibacillus sp. PAMC21692 TaxID=2762320 RepID=UPI00164EB98E|nr:Wzz/FepE/Etk N-terminal domain-containing protein [Paenibacillus sp. PAMC21692]QNK55281.1 lipopolysaccharide biosynthesis protein [Paenibacillus sp. PAMC21692]
MELKQYGLILKKRLVMILLLVTVSCLGIGLYSGYFLQPQYQASAKLIVNQYKDSGSLLPSIDVGAINSTIGLIKTYKEIIKTPRMMKKVVQQYPELGVTHSELIGRVSVSSVNETQVMSITVKGSSYQEAANMANAIAIVFQQSVPELMKVDNVSILDQANPLENRGAVSPNIKLNVTVAFLLALMLGVGIAFLLEYLDDTVKSEEDIDMLLQVPVLSAIPTFREKDSKERGDKPETALKAGRGNNATLDA